MKTFKFITTLVFLTGSLAADEPCTPGVDKEPDTCIRDGNVCTMDTEGCCAGLKCTGFAFFSKCTLPPVCLEEWYDCSDGTECCDGMKCTETNLGGWECRVPEIATRTVKLPGVSSNLIAEKKKIQAINETQPPTAAPRLEEKNLRTTKVPGAPITYNVGTVWGDPHGKLSSVVVDTFQRSLSDFSHSSHHCCCCITTQSLRSMDYTTIAKGASYMH